MIDVAAGFGNLLLEYVSISLASGNVLSEGDLTIMTRFNNVSEGMKISMCLGHFWLKF